MPPRVSISTVTNRITSWMITRMPNKSSPTSPPKSHFWMPSMPNLGFNLEKAHCSPINNFLKNKRMKNPATCLYQQQHHYLNRLSYPLSFLFSLTNEHHLKKISRIYHYPILFLINTKDSSKILRNREQYGRLNHHIHVEDYKSAPCTLTQGRKVDLSLFELVREKKKMDSIH